MLDGDISGLIARLIRSPSLTGRRILAVAGPRRSGKSTVSETLADSGERSAAQIIPRATEVLVVEGNYLPLDRPRWRDHGVPADEISARVEGNELPDGLTVLNESIAADVTMRSGQSTNQTSH